MTRVPQTNSETGVCPLCEGDPMRVPFPALPTLAECPSCRMMLRTDRFEVSNPNRAYEEKGEGSVKRLLSEEKQRAPYYSKLVSRIEESVDGPGPLLEIGVGTGGLMNRLLESGWRAEGIEASPSLYAAAQETVGDRGRVHPARLEEAEELLTLRPYLAIVAIDILEHLPDLNLLPSLAYRWLQPGGVLILQTPNSLALRRFLQKEGWEQLAPGEHYIFHSERSLRRLLEETGFDEIEIETVSGTATDGILSRAAMKPAEKILNLLTLGNALWALARKGPE